MVNLLLDKIKEVKVEPNKIKPEVARIKIVLEAKPKRINVDDKESMWYRKHRNGA
jgi:hypothetical protein